MRMCDGFHALLIQHGSSSSCNIQCEIVADTVLPMERGLYQPIGGLTHQTSRWSVISFKGLHQSSSWRSSPWRKAPLTSLTSPFSSLNSASRKTGRKVGELRPQSAYESPLVFEVWPHVLSSCGRFPQGLSVPRTLLRHGFYLPHCRHVD